MSVGRCSVWLVMVGLSAPLAWAQALAAASEAAGEASVPAPAEVALEASFLPYARTEFAPARGDRFAVPFRLTAAAEVTLEIFTPDGDAVIALTSDGPLDAGDHALTWDGRDRDQQAVPAEAYVPVLTATGAHGEQIVTVDPRERSGGETLDPVPVRFTSEGDIEYRLPAAARVLLRVGVAGGPMLRELLSWSPRPAGQIVHRWNGKDAAGAVRIAGLPRLRVMAAAFALPDHAILVSENPEGPTYLAWREQWVDGDVEPATSAADPGPLARGDARISRFYYQSRAYSTPPRVMLSLSDADSNPEQVGASTAALASPFEAGAPMRIRVDVPKEDRWLLQRSQYEVAFFIDGDFVSEEESGYVPLTWVYDPAGLTPGEHQLVVNVSGFQGQVGVAMTPFTVKAPAP